MSSYGRPPSFRSDYTESHAGDSYYPASRSSSSPRRSEEPAYFDPRMEAGYQGPSHHRHARSSSPGWDNYDYDGYRSRHRPPPSRRGGYDDEHRGRRGYATSDYDHPPPRSSDRRSSRRDRDRDYESDRRSRRRSHSVSSYHPSDSETESEEESDDSARSSRRDRKKGSKKSSKEDSKDDDNLILSLIQDVFKPGKSGKGGKAELGAIQKLLKSTGLVDSKEFSSILKKLQGAVQDKTGQAALVALVTAVLSMLTHGKDRTTKRSKMQEALLPALASIAVAFMSRKKSKSLLALAPTVGLILHQALKSRRKKKLAKGESGYSSADSAMSRASSPARSIISSALASPISFRSRSSSRRNVAPSSTDTEDDRRGRSASRRPPGLSTNSKRHPSSGRESGPETSGAETSGGESDGRKSMTKSKLDFLRSNAAKTAALTGASFAGIHSVYRAVKSHKEEKKQQQQRRDREKDQESGDESYGSLDERDRAPVSPAGYSLPIQVSKHVNNAAASSSSSRSYSRNGPAGGDTTDDYTDSEPPRQAQLQKQIRSVKGKILLTAVITLGATINATNSVYTGMTNVRGLVKTTRSMPPADVAKYRLRLLMEEVATFGISSLSVAGSAGLWKRLVGLVKQLTALQDQLKELDGRGVRGVKGGLKEHRVRPVPAVREMKDDRSVKLEPVVRKLDRNVDHPSEKSDLQPAAPEPTSSGTHSGEQVQAPAPAGHVHGSGAQNVHGLRIVEDSAEQSAGPARPSFDRMPSWCGRCEAGLYGQSTWTDQFGAGIDNEQISDPRPQKETRTALEPEAGHSPLAQHLHTSASPQPSREIDSEMGNSSPTSSDNTLPDNLITPELLERYRRLRGESPPRDQPSCSTQDPARLHPGYHPRRRAVPTSNTSGGSPSSLMTRLSREDLESVTALSSVREFDPNPVGPERVDRSPLFPRAPVPTTDGLSPASGAHDFRRGQRPQAEQGLPELGIRDPRVWQGIRPEGRQHQVPARSTSNWDHERESRARPFDAEYTERRQEVSGSWARYGDLEESVSPRERTFAGTGPAPAPAPSSASSRHPRGSPLPALPVDADVPPARVYLSPEEERRYLYQQRDQGRQ